jgi:peptide/nickel transport system ATP-binding protein
VSGTLSHPLRDDVRARAAAILQATNLSVGYETAKGVVPAVADVSFSLAAGETLALVGESGCGKTTLAFAAIGFLSTNGVFTGGSMSFLDHELTTLSKSELRRIRGRQVSMVYQDPASALNPTMRIGKQLTEVLTEHQQISETEAAKRCVEMLERVHMPDAAQVMRRYPHELSGGQQQRVVIAAGLLNRPSLLIMDEPTTGLDVTIEAAVLDLVQEIKADLRTAVLFITHNLGVVARVAERVAVMYAGRIVETGTVEQILTEPAHPYTRGLIDCVPRLGAWKGDTTLRPIPGSVPSPGSAASGCAFAARCAYVAKRCTRELPPLEPLPDQRAARCFYANEILAGARAPARTTAPPSVRGAAAATEGTLLQVSSLRKRYRQTGSLPMPGRPVRAVHAVEDVTLDLKPGTTLGIVGESGSGKTTMAKLLLGVQTPDDGTMELLGIDLTAPVTRRTRDTLRLLQMVFQDPDSTLNPSMKVGDAVGRAVRKLTDTPRKHVRARVVELLESVKLAAHYCERLPRQLSGGEKQRVAIARALAGDPRLIVADEPTSALDVSVQAAVLNLLLEIEATRKASFILISHDLSVVLYLADHIAVMYLGHIVEYGPRDAFLRPPHHPYTEGLLSAIPIPDPRVEPEKIRLSPVIPSAIDPPPGCVFHTRCPRYIGDVCHTPPPTRAFGDHWIDCHHDPDYLASVGAEIVDAEASG